MGLSISPDPVLPVRETPTLSPSCAPRASSVNCAELQLIATDDNERVYTQSWIGFNEANVCLALEDVETFALINTFSCHKVTVSEAYVALVQTRAFLCCFTVASADEVTIALRKHPPVLFLCTQTLPIKKKKMMLTRKYC